MKPTGIPLAVSCLHLISPARSAASTRMLNTRGIEYPSYRFRPYSTLDEETILLARFLGYDDRTWNALGSNPWEIYSFETIQSYGTSMVIDSIQKIGFTGEVWDCYINHYRDFSWQKLADEGVVVFAVILGWDEEMWDGLTSAPETEFMLWDKLTTGQQQAAVEFCFTKQLWDAVDLEDWESFSSIATSTPSGESTGTEETRPDDSPLAAPTISPSSAIATNGPITDASSRAPAVPQSLSPAGRPTVSPTAQQNVPGTVSPSMGTQESAGPTQMLQDIDDAPSVPSVDDIRYVVWGSLQETKRKLATELGYDQDNWNTPGTADIEYYSIQGLFEAEIKGAPDKIAELGFSEEQWDCYVHHYISFSWETIVEIGVDGHFISLGWSQPSWDGETDAPPASEEKSWEELTEEERAGAVGLCYLLQTWDGYSLDDPAWKTAATESPSSEKVEVPPTDAKPAESSSSGRNMEMRLFMLTVVSISTIFLL